MIINIYMTKDQYEIYSENFVIMRENKKRKNEFVNQPIKKK